MNHFGWICYIGCKVWQSYVENKTSGALRLFWCYGPGRKYITVVGLSNHPESSKRGAYDKVVLSKLPTIENSLFMEFFDKFSF